MAMVTDCVNFTFEVQIDGKYQSDPRFGNEVFAETDKDYVYRMLAEELLCKINKSKYYKKVEVRDLGTDFQQVIVYLEEPEMKYPKARRIYCIEKL